MRAVLEGLLFYAFMVTLGGAFFYVLPALVEATP